MRSYEEQWTEEEFEKMCQVESPESPKVKEEAVETGCPTNSSSSIAAASNIEAAAIPPSVPTLPSVESLPEQQTKEITPPAKRGRGRPKRITSDKSPAVAVPLAPSAAVGVDMQLQKGTLSGPVASASPHSAEVVGTIGPVQQSDTGVTPSSQVATHLSTGVPNFQSTIASASVSVPIQARGQGRKTQIGGEAPRRRGKKQAVVSSPIPSGSGGPDLKVNDQLEDKSINPSAGQATSQSGTISSIATVHQPNTISASASLDIGKDHHLGVGIALNPQVSLPLPSVTPVPQTAPTCPTVAIQNKSQSRKLQNGGGAPRRRGKKQDSISPVIPDISGHQESHLNSSLQVSSGSALSDKATDVKSLQENDVQESKDVIQEQSSLKPGNQDLKLSEKSDDLAQQTAISPSTHDHIAKAPGGYVVLFTGTFDLH